MKTILELSPSLRKTALACCALLMGSWSMASAADLVITDELITETFTTNTTLNYDDLIVTGNAQYRVNATGGSNVVTVNFDGDYLPSTAQPTTLWLLTGTTTAFSVGTLGDRVEMFFNNTTLPTAITPSGTPPIGWQPIVHPSIVTRSPDNTQRLAALYQDTTTGELTMATTVATDIQDPDTNQFSIFQAAANSGSTVTLNTSKTVYAVEVVGNIATSDADHVLTVASGLFLLNNTGGNRASNAIINFGDQTGYLQGDSTRNWAFNAAVQGTNGIVVSDTGRPSSGIPSTISFGSDANTFIGDFSIVSGNVEVSGGTAGSGGDGVGLNRDGVFINLYIGSDGSFNTGGRNQSIGELTGAGTLSNSTATASLLAIHVEDAESADFSGVITNDAGALTLEKTGDGTQVLSGTNTYTGDTLVTAGTLVLADGGTLLFNIADDGVNNQIGGTGDLLLDGTLVLDLSGAGTTVGNSWQLVDVVSLTTSFGGTFSVASLEGGFSASNGIWTRMENNVEYQFDQATGTLSVIPEPSTGLLLGIGLGLALMVRRRIQSRPMV